MQQILDMEMPTFVSAANVCVTFILGFIHNFTNVYEINMIYNWNRNHNKIHLIESDKTTSIYNVSTRVLSKK